MAMPFLAARGQATGSAAPAASLVATARSYLDQAECTGTSIVLPADLVAAPRAAADAPHRVVPAGGIPPGWAGLDIGPATAAMFAERIAGARTVFWNGPMGMFELAPYAEGTTAIAQAIADSRAFTLVGGQRGPARRDPGGRPGRPADNGLVLRLEDGRLRQSVRADRPPGSGPMALSQGARTGLAGDMFVVDEVMLDITFPAARTGLARLALDGLLRASQDAYGHGTAGLKRAGGPGGLVLTRVQARPLARARDRAGLAIRWEAAGPGSELFSVLDADLSLVPAGQHATLLTLSGAYRPAPGDMPDRAILHQVAAATIRNFLSRLAAGIASEHGPAGPAPAESAPPPPRRAPRRP